VCGGGGMDDTEIGISGVEPSGSVTTVLIKMLITMNS
jgi:hypothetical protein